MKTTPEQREEIKAVGEKLFPLNSDIAGCARLAPLLCDDIDTLIAENACTRCKGSGEKECYRDASEDCAACKGTGKRTVQLIAEFDEYKRSVGQRQVDSDTELSELIVECDALKHELLCKVTMWKLDVEERDALRKALEKAKNGVQILFPCVAHQIAIVQEIQAIIDAALAAGIGKCSGGAGFGSCRDGRDNELCGVCEQAIATGTEGKNG
jgi:hypothetical protein